MRDELTNRYVTAVLSVVPRAERARAERDVRARIDALLAARGSRDEHVVREVLTELGDPAELAATYGAGRRFLIGPDLYPTYVKLLGTLIAIVVPIVFAAVLAVNLWEPAGRVELGLGDALSTAVQTGVMIAFWVTLVFAILERAGVLRGQVAGREGKGWSPDDLPKRSAGRQITFAETVTSVIFLVLLIGLVLWQESHSVIYRGGAAVPLLDRELWNWWIPALIALLVVMIGVEIWKFVAGRWTLPLVIANVGMNVIFAAFVVVLLRTQRVVNPAFERAAEEAAGTQLPGDVMGMVIVGLVAAVAVWDSIDCIVKYARARA